MSSLAPVTVQVPATTANLGPGFDCLGAALSIYNRFQFHLSSSTPLQIRVTGTEAAQVSTNKSNLIYQAMVSFYEAIQQPVPNIAIDIELGVPLARGLGSSATAIVGGLVGANHLAGKPLAPSEVMELAIAIEGHPDNVVPALLGNCQLSVRQEEQWQICAIPWHQDLVPVVAIPDFELSTQEARSVLPTQITRSDAIFNAAHLGLLLRGLATNRGDWLKVAMADRLHQPYRQKLIRGYTEVKVAAIAAGAYGVVISGAGPTLLALTKGAEAEAVAASMEQAWQKLDILAQAFPLSIDTEGAKVI